MELDHEDYRINNHAAGKRTATANADWLMKAIEQKSAHLTVGVANSELMVYDGLDLQLLIAFKSN